MQGLDLGSAGNDQVTAVGSGPIGNFTVIPNIENGDVGVFSWLDRSLGVLELEGTGGVNSRGSDRLGGRHLHLRAGERQNKRHARNRRRAGIEVSREGKRYATIN